VITHDPRASSIDIGPAAGTSRTLESFTPAPGTYFMTAHLETIGYNAPSGGTLGCYATGSTEEPYPSVAESLQLPQARSFDPQVTIRTVDQPVVLGCSVSGVAEAEYALIESYQLTLIRIDPQPVG
jgi:hypothetical protein